ncbi:hypothetical protein K435DRAFT_808628 [Dendrothele bispora CBS 962.96]|uniref:Uncharacterized protein n=1 Tax=Dendrothele bispora (strain CBS 962.96) TaxID=1314807 RepID=A0A4S8L185_DENBC|nr:hypothetical protein K435DRAFT_808628 [Dendrothele bispora CBS 962.96]
MLGAAKFDEDNDENEDYRDEDEEYEYDDGSDGGFAKKVSKVTKRPLEPKEAKLAIRQEIIATHTIKPQQQVQPLKNVKHQAGSNITNEQSKKRVKATLGGLDKDWKTVYRHRSAATSSSSVTSTRTQSSNRVVGEFDVEESAEVTEMSRQTKLSKVGVHNPKQAVVNVKFVPANVAEIDRKDRVKRTPGSIPGRRNVPSSKNLPFVYPQDKQIWENHFLPELYSWQGVVKEQFSSFSHSKFASVVWNAWLQWFDHLPAQYHDVDGATCKRVNHPAIQSVAQAALSTYRSDLANKKALLYVEQKMNEEVIPEEDSDTTEHRKVWVQEQLDDQTFQPIQEQSFFENACLSSLQDAGQWEICLVQPSCGGIGLECCSSVLSALSLSERMVSSPRSNLRTILTATVKSESNKQCATVLPALVKLIGVPGTVNHYFDKFTSKLSNSKYEEIVAYAEFYLPESSKALLRSTQEGVDENDELVMSN